VARAITQRADQGLDLLDAEPSMTVARFAVGLRTAFTGLIVSSPLRTAWAQIDCRTASDLANGRRPEPVGLERLAQRLHRRRRQLAQLEVADARQQIAVPDLCVGGEGVAGQPPARVVGPPVILDELAEDNAASTELIQRSSASGEAQVRVVVDGVIGGVELLASALAADRVGPAHAERPNRTPHVPAGFDATWDLGLGRPLTHRIPMLADA
jgi:hypothetical protein